MLSVIYHSLNLHKRHLFANTLNDVLLSSYIEPQHLFDFFVMIILLPPLSTD